MSEIVRCKDCKHYNFETHGCKRSPSVERWWKDDFCSYGEKQVASKLNNADDSLLTADSNGCKEQKSKLESVDTPTDTPTNTPTDLISRQAAIEALGEEPDIALDTEEEWAEHDAWARHVRAIESLPPVEDMGEVSDGYHTFNQLYHQRAVLFATIVNQNKDKAWKSWKHEDGQFCFDKGGEWFIVGIDTPDGSYTYHYEKKYWDMFDCEELDRGKHWDGHTEDDVTRLLSLPPVESQPVCEDAISRQAAIEAIEERFFAGTVADINPSWRLLHEIIESLPPVTPTEQNEEDILKFYYVESLDEYWIGQRHGTMYYGKWTGNCFTFTHSRYLPWGEHVVAPDTLWKEHTYPSEPKEIPFNEWLQGFLQRECQSERPKGECRTCKRCSDHCCETDEDFTRCPIEEHYRLPKDGYCHLYQQI